MTVLSRGARVRRGGRRPGWVLLTTLLVLAIGASSALVFTNRVELLKLAVILALWAAVAGAFVSVVYRRQADADQARARDMKLVYDLQLDREISARREYELTVESQLRRELASELRGAAADEVAALRAELATLRTSLEILFDADLQPHPALETVTQNGVQPSESPAADWVASDRVRAVRPDEPVSRADETTIIDVPEVRVPPAPAAPLPPPRQPTPTVERPETLPQPEPAFAPRHRQPSAPVPQMAPPPPPMAPPPPQMAPPQQPSQPRPSEWQPPQPAPSEWQPVAAEGQWLPPGAPGSRWAYAEPVAPAPPVAPPPPVEAPPVAAAPPPPVEAPPPPPAAPPTDPPQAPRSGRRRRAQDADAEDEGDITPARPDFQQDSQQDLAPQYGGRRSRSRHSAEYRDFGVAGLGASLERPEPIEPPPPVPPAATRPPAEPPRLAAPPPPEPTSRHRSAEEETDGTHSRDPETGGQSVADLMARLQVDPSGGGRRRRRSG